MMELSTSSTASSVAMTSDRLPDSSASAVRTTSSTQLAAKDSTSARRTCASSWGGGCGSEMAVGWQGWRTGLLGVSHHLL